jgi:SAM-dependent methyltransferase
MAQYKQKMFIPQGTKINHIYSTPESAHWLSSTPVFHGEREVFEWLSRMPDRTIFDIGCGPGRLYDYLKSFGYDYEGIDLFPAQIESFQRLHPGARVKVGDATNLPWANASAGCAILGYHVLESIRPRASRDLVIREARRVLQPGGFLVISFHRRSLRIWVKILVRAMKRRGELGDLVFAPSPLAGVDQESMVMHVASRREMRVLRIRSGFRRIRGWDLTRGSSRNDAIVEVWQAG